MNDKAETMSARILPTLLLLAMLAGPGVAGAFSFGTFDPSDEIASIVLGSTTATPLVQHTGATSTMVFTAEVTTINMKDGDVFNVTPGDVTFSSQVMLVGGSEIFAPNPFPTFLSGEYRNGVTVDFSITDIADSSNVLLEAEYDDSLVWTANQLFPGAVNGTLDGDFDVVSGDSDFTDAFAPGLARGTFNAQMTAFLSNGSAVNQACELTTTGGTSNLSCFGLAADGFDNWTSNPVVTIVPIPEPGTALLLASGMIGLAGRRQRSLR